MWTGKFLNPERKSSGFKNIRIRVYGVLSGSKFSFAFLQFDFVITLFCCLIFQFGLLVTASIFVIHGFQRRHFMITNCNGPFEFSLLLLHFVFLLRWLSPLPRFQFFCFASLFFEQQFGVQSQLCFDATLQPIASSVQFLILFFRYAIQLCNYAVQPCCYAVNNIHEKITR